jgi:hypothetical protein
MGISSASKAAITTRRICKGVLPSFILQLKEIFLFHKYGIQKLAAKPVSATEYLWVGVKHEIGHKQKKASFWG